jgi:hypothetical protein
VLLTLLAMLASAYHFHPRPHLLSILFLGWTFALLVDFEAGRVPLKRLAWLLPLFALWTNIHGGMLGGFGTLAVTAFGWMVARRIWLEGPKLSPRQAFALVMLVVACGLTAFFNPYGVALPRTWFSLLGSPLLPRLIDEHAPLLQSGWAGAAIVLFGVVNLAALIGVLPGRLRVSWFVPLVWLALSFTRVRHGPLFAITAVLALVEMFPHIRWVSWLAEKGSVMCRVRPATTAKSGQRFDSRPLFLPILVVSSLLIVQAAGHSLPLLGRDWVRLDPRSCPTELLPELRTIERENPTGTPIFNEMLFGGFLIYYAPGLRVFIDDRCELYGDNDLMTYALALRDDPSQLDHWANRYGFHFALTRAGSSFDTHLRHKGWTILGETKTATLFRRDVHDKDAPNR